MVSLKCRSQYFVPFLIGATINMQLDTQGFAAVVGGSDKQLFAGHPAQLDQRSFGILWQQVFNNIKQTDQVETVVLKWQLPGEALDNAVVDGEIVDRFNAHGVKAQAAAIGDHFAATTTHIQVTVAAFCGAAQVFFCLQAAGIAHAIVLVLIYLLIFFYFLLLGIAQNTFSNATRGKQVSAVWRVQLMISSP